MTIGIVRLSAKNLKNLDGVSTNSVIAKPRAHSLTDHLCISIFKCTMSHGTVCYLYSLHPDVYTLVNIINIET